METLKLEKVCKVYEGQKLKDDDVLAVSDFNLTVEDNEFIVFVGPSGCGKSTTLRMIAGLEDITSGNLYIDGQLMNKVEPNYRNIAMVFQNYALYPHMSAYKIMAFGLKNRHVPKDEIDRRIKAAAKILDIEDLLNRKPKAMSGGQRQRVALGRAIVQTPKIFLLDEPLSNLDAKLRAQMRVEINKLYEKLKTTFIYVTHDQVEAMTMGTRIVVMKKGFVQQIDTPATLFDYPKNRFVAGFLGTPQMNFYEGFITRHADSVTFKIFNQELTYQLKDLREINKAYLDGEEHKMILGIRPEDLIISSDGDLKARVNIIEALGSESLVYADFDLEKESGLQQSETSLIAKTNARTTIKNGDVITLRFNPSKIHLFADEPGEKSIMLTPRTARFAYKGYLSKKDSGYSLSFENLRSIDFDLPYDVNEIYKSGMHRVKLDISDALKLNAKGNIELVYQGEGLMDGVLTQRFDLKDVSYDESFENSLTHVYLKTSKKLNIGDVVKASIDFNKATLIGDDKLPISDLNEKSVEVDEYKVEQVKEEKPKKKLKTLKQIMRIKYKEFQEKSKEKKKAKQLAKEAASENAEQDSSDTNKTTK